MTFSRHVKIRKSFTYVKFIVGLSVKTLLILFPEEEQGFFTLLLPILVLRIHFMFRDFAFASILYFRSGNVS